MIKLYLSATMFGWVKILCILFNLHYIFIECSISSAPDLTVRKLDKKMVERRRQDTLDMCRLFAETQKVDLSTDNQLRADEYDTIKQQDHLKDKVSHRRFKREVRPMNAVNPALNAEDEQRVEKIVDTIYDDLLQKGQDIPYRRLAVNETNVKGVGLASNKSGRRFDFAPAGLEPAEPPTSAKPQIKDEEIYSGKPPRFVHGIVPYFIDSKTYDTQLADIIMKAFDYFEKATCIRLQRLRERPTDLQSLQNVIWLYITNPSGIRQCVHSNDRVVIKGVQMIVFGYDCMSLGDITHEIMHVLGFAHEHVRPDRDQYITVLWDNIKPGYRKYFEIQNKPVVENLPYDYASVLHYPPRAFSRNGKVTIMTEPGIKVGQREGLSEMDVEKISTLYSNECVKRNREYLLKTCPSVVRANTQPPRVKQEEIEDYFQDRLWPYGVVNYKFRDRMEFSTEEIENIRAVIRHLEKETCIEFRDLTENTQLNDKETDTESDSESSDSGVEKYVQLGMSKNDTKAQLPDLSSTSDELNTNLNEIKVEDKDAIRKGAEGKDKGKKGARIKRAIPPTPKRRHASDILVLVRSPQPGCYCPHPGRPEGQHVLKINNDCFNSVNDLLHLFVHVLGLDHQHNMHDRDSYLHIVWDQLTEDVRKEMKGRLPPAASVGFPYDYQSVMHYPWLQIKNGRTNIMYPIWNDGWAMGHWQGLSSTDVQKLNLLYFKQCILRKALAEDPHSIANEK